MDLVLVRHPETNAQKGTCYGRVDFPLKEPVRKTTIETFASLRFPYSHCVASPLPRAKALAEDLLLYHSESQTKAMSNGPESNSIQATNLLFDPRLQEMDFGDWDGKLWDELPKRETMLWMADFVNRKTPNGEAFTDVIARTKSFLEDWSSNGNKRQEAESLAGKKLDKLLVVAHSGSIRAILCQLDEIPFDKAFEEKIEFGSVRVRKL